MFRDILNSKIGNLVGYLANEIQPLSLTKLLKLLFMIDEKAVLETGAPITWLEYKAWAEGPVAEEIYQELKNNTILVAGDKELTLAEYITVSKEYNQARKHEEVSIKPKAYSLHEYSRFEKELIDSIIAEFGKLPASRLIEILHREDSIWARTVAINSLEKDFVAFSKKSSVNIHLTELIADDDLLLLSSKSAYESLRFHEKFC